MAAHHIRVITFIAFTVVAFGLSPVQAQTPNSGPIDALQKDLAALTARVNKLEGKNIKREDLVGTYDLFNFQTEKHAALAPGGFSQVSSYVDAASFTLKPDGTGSASGTGEHGSTLFFNNTSPPSLTKFSPANPEGTFTFTWTYDENTRTVNFVADNCSTTDCSFSLRFYTAGPAFIFTDANHGPEPRSGHEILEIGVRRN